MINIAIYFDNSLEQTPFVLSRQNGIIRINLKFSKFKLIDDTVTLGYQDTIDSLRRLKSINNNRQKRIEILFGLNIGYSKGDEAKRWSFSKQDIIGDRLNKDFLKLLRNYENGKIVWKDFYNEVIKEKQNIITAVEEKYKDLKKNYAISAYKEEWLEQEFALDSYFLCHQFQGIKLDNRKINELLKDLNFQKYKSLYYLEKNYKIDISSEYISDELMHGLVLSYAKNEEKVEELSELFQVLNAENSMIEAIRTVRECKIDYSNLIRHYSLNENQLIYPQYNTISSCSGRILISSPGTQYLKKSKRDIFCANDGCSLVYFDFRNYEPGIAAGLSGDDEFIKYYNSGDMYSKISLDYYGSNEMRKNVKISILAYLYGMSEESLKKYFKKTNDFNPDNVIELLNKFTVFQKWKTLIIKQSKKDFETVQRVYTRKYLSTKEWKINTSAVNHVVQSTGSMILKKCINKIVAVSGVKVLIPMHDAILCELDNNNIDRLKLSVSNLMENTFAEIIKNAKSRVIIGNFAE